MRRDGRERVGPGGHGVDLADRKRPVALWCAPVANTRVQATTGAGPALRLPRAPWLPLTARPRDETRVVVPRRVSAACRVADAGQHDAVPCASGGRRGLLRVRAAQATREIWAEDPGLAVHPLLPGHGRQRVHPAHRTGLWRLTRPGTGPRIAPVSAPPGAPPWPRLPVANRPAMPAVEVRPWTGYAAVAEAVSA
jgi:hypothetical protein